MKMLLPGNAGWFTIKGIEGGMRADQNEVCQTSNVPGVTPKVPQCERGGAAECGQRPTIGGL